MDNNIRLGFANSSDLLNKGYLLLTQKQYDHAITIFNQMLTSDPNDPSALVGLASAYQHKKKTDQAIKTAQQALEVDPAYYHAYDILAEIYFINKNDYTKAEHFALRSLELQPYESSTYSLLAQIYYFQKYYKASYEYAQQALSIDPLNYVAHMTLGLFYWHIPDYDKAEEHFKACLSIAPDCSVAYGNYGLLSLALAENKMGYKLLKESLNLNPEDKFLQECFRDAYIRNNPIYAPLYWITDGKFDDVYIIYANIIAMILCGFFYGMGFLPEFVRIILLITFLLNVASLFTLVIYRLATRFLINRYYSWHIKKGTLSKII